MQPRFSLAEVPYTTLHAALQSVALTCAGHALLSTIGCSSECLSSPLRALNSFLSGARAVVVSRCYSRVERARLVAKGCSQRFGEETFSPVACFESIWSVIALGAQHKLQLHQMDVTTAFLHGELSEEVYMEQPVGYVASGKEHIVCLLKRSIHGLKQASRCWNYGTAHMQRHTHSNFPRV